MSDVWKLGILDLARAYAAGETDPVAVTRCHLERIARLDPQLNAFALAAPDAERSAMESAARIKAGAQRSPLEGVPLAVKDNLVVAGMPAAWGSAVFAGETRAEDELPIRRLREAGAVFLGKTNTPEFAVEGYTASETFGVTGNPWNPDLTPGGSSGGSVAAVAAGLAAAAVGTDGGGSIRRPAGHTGLFGLKPTIGSVPRSGGLPQVLLDFEVVGGLARSAADLRTLHDILSGPDLSDPVSRFAPRRAAPDRRLRILHVEMIGDNPCDPRITASIRAAAGRLERLGHDVERGELPFDLDDLNAFWPRFGAIGLAHMRHTVPGMAKKAAGKYLAMAQEAETVSARELFAALEAVRDLRAAASRFFGSWDVIMTPSAAAQPWPAGQPFPPLIDGKQVGPRGHAVYTGWVNASGHPAVNVPSAFDDEGMPIGFQMIGDLFMENMLLDLAAEFEASGPGWRWPSFALA